MNTASFRRLVGGIVATLAVGACAASTEPLPGIVTARVVQSSVLPGASFRLTASRSEKGTFYISRCAWYLQTRIAGKWVRSTLPPTTCESPWIGVSAASPGQIVLELPWSAGAGEYRIELVVSPFDLNAGPVITVAPLVEATVLSNSFLVLAAR